MNHLPTFYYYSMYDHLPTGRQAAKKSARLFPLFLGSSWATSFPKQNRTGSLIWNDRTIQAGAQVSAWWQAGSACG